MTPHTRALIAANQALASNPKPSRPHLAALGLLIAVSSCAALLALLGG